MNIEYYNDGYPYIVIDDVYDTNELNLIWRELDFLLDGNKFDEPEKTGSAVGNDVVLKKNGGIWLDDAYSDRKFSNILTCNRKLYKELESIWSGSESWWFRSLLGSKSILNQDYTLLSYYDQEDYYKPHYDKSILTSLTWLYREPKGFDGGDFILNPTMDKKHLLNETTGSETVELKNNRTVMFPGIIPHQVTSVKMNCKNKKGMGRFCISNFLNTA